MTATVRWPSGSSQDVEEAGALPESITITDNRTGDQLEIPIEHGGVSAAEWRSCCQESGSTIPA